MKKIKTVFSPLGFQINLSGAPQSKPNLFCFSNNSSHPFVSTWQSGMGESVLLFSTNPSQHYWWVQVGLCRERISDKAAAYQTHSLTYFRISLNAQKRSLFSSQFNNFLWKTKYGEFVPIGTSLKFRASIYFASRSSQLILLNCDRGALTLKETSAFPKLNNVMEALPHWFFVCN